MEKESESNLCTESSQSCVDSRAACADGSASLPTWQVYSRTGPETAIKSRQNNSRLAAEFAGCRNMIDRSDDEKDNQWVVQHGRRGAGRDDWSGG